MITLLFTFAVTFVLLLAGGLFIGFSKRRQGKTRHAQTGTCRETGEEMCGCGGAQVQHLRQQSRRSSQLPSSCCAHPGSRTKAGDS